MKIRCKENIGEYSIDKDDSFTVQGVRWANNEDTEYLVTIDGNGFTVWLSAEKCEVLDKIIPEGWSMAFQEETEDKENNYLITSGFVLGYEELVNNPLHSVGLLEMNKRVVDIFLQNKQSP